MRDAESVTFGGGGAGATAGLDRSAHLRPHAEALAEAAAGPDAVVLALWRGKPAVATDGPVPRLAMVPDGHPVLAESREPPVFLGMAEGRAVFAADVSAWVPPNVDLQAIGGFSDTSAQVHPALPGSVRFMDLRGVMTGLSDLEAEIAATGRALTGWHATHGHCARCGAPTVACEGGWQRRCPACGARHFPRTDPVVIMLVTRGNAALVGRTPGWPSGMYSLLAGFMEPGETLEAAVRREVHEEAGLDVTRVRYLASQPWPFPASLMLGCAAEAGPGPLVIDPAEIEDARWVTREEMVEVFCGTHAEIRQPRPGAIAHFLLRRWLADALD